MVGPGIQTGRLLEGAVLRNSPQFDSPRQFRDADRLRRFAKGFTLIELMVVISIILILIGMAAGLYGHAVVRAKEAKLKNDLKVMRVAIDNFTLDKQTAPQSLQDLVDAQYLREIPIDPITNAADWDLHIGDTVLSPEQGGPGVDDVHSHSEAPSSTGTPYNTW
jgi:general secretion pathway protein G